MKKLLLSLAMAAMLPAMASADSFDITFNGDKTNPNWEPTDQYTKTISSKTEFGGTIWEAQNFSNYNNGWAYIKGGSKKNASVASIYNVNALTHKVTSVSVTVDKVTAKNLNSAKLFVADNSDFTNAEEITFSGTVAAGTWDFTITAPAANKYYKFAADCSKASSNGIIQISKFTFNYTAEEGVVTAPVMTPASGWIAAGSGVTLTAGEGASIYYTLNGDEPSTSSMLYDGNPITVNEDLTIKAIATKDGKTSTVKEAAYNVYKANSAENPLSVSDALSLIDKGFPKTIEVFVQGTISSIDDVTDENLAQYGNMTYTINEGDAQISLKIFRGLYLDNEKFTSKDQIAVGDKVVVKGKILVYNGTKEMDQYNYIVSIEKAPVTKCATPVFSRESGSELIKGDVVTISTSTEGAVIRYTVGETTATSESNTVDVTVNESCTITAIAVKEGLEDSEEATATYTIPQLGEGEFEYSFDFTGDEAYGMALLSGNTSETNPSPYVCNGENITLTLDGSGNDAEKPNYTRWWKASNGNELRFYTGSFFTIAGKNENILIKKVELIGATNGNWTDAETESSYNSGTWTGNANSVTLKTTITSKNTALKAIKVLYQIPAAVEGIEADSTAPARYFNLQGVEVSKPTHGLFIRVQGKKADKVIF